MIQPLASQNGTFLFLFLIACDPLSSAHVESDSGLSIGQNALVVSPATLDFGTISVIEDGSSRQSFTVTNAGSETLAVHGHDEIIALEGDAEAVFEVAADPIFELLPGDSQELSINFQPGTEGRWAAELRVNYGVELLRLEAMATAPVIEVETARTEAVAVGCSERLEVEVGNSGSEPLLVDSAQLFSGQDYAIEDSIDLPMELDPGETQVVPMVFSPHWTVEADDTRTDTLWIDSNDPLFPSVSADLESVAYWGTAPDESFVFAPGIETDLLFVIDTDGVMGIYAQQAQAILGSFVESLDQANVDLHTSVLSHTSSCPLNSPAFMGSDDSAAEVLEFLQDGFDGPGGLGSTALGEHAANALENDTPGGCLEGFLREDAQLHIILVSGDQDSSTVSVDGQVSRLWGEAPEASELRISVLVPTSTEACSGVSIGAGYMELAAETDGAIEDLCLDDWSGPFQAFANISIEAEEGELLHVLNSPPVPESIHVSAGGLVVDDWSWESALGAIRFSEETSITPGEWVTLSYAAALECVE